MSARPYMKLFIADYLGDTMHLSTEEHGAYLLLLMAMWRGDGWLPNDPQKLARMARVSPRRWHLIAPTIMPFMVIEGDRVTQARLLREHQEASSISEKRSTAAKSGKIDKSLENNDAASAIAEQKQTYARRVPQPYPDISSETSSLRSAQASQADGADEALQPMPRKRGTRLPEDWWPAEHLKAFARQELNDDIACRRETERFKNHWAAAAGNSARKVDWGAAYRNWILKAADSRPRARPTGSREAPPRRIAPADELKLALDDMNLERFTHRGP